MLETEPSHIVLVDVLAHRRLIVIAVAPTDMAYAVEMGPDMALAEPGILHVGKIVLTERSARRHRARSQDGFCKARTEERYTVDQRMRHRRHLAGLNLGGCRLGHGRGHAVGGACLIVFPKERCRNGLRAIALGKGT